MPVQTSLAMPLALTLALFVPLVAAFPSARAAATTATLQPVIVNGSSMAVSYMSEAFLFCWVDAPTQQVEWLDPTNTTLPTWSFAASRYQLGFGMHLPHAYLVFVDFRREHEGVYTCVAQGGAGDAAHTSVAVTLQPMAWPRL